MDKPNRNQRFRVIAQAILQTLAVTTSACTTTVRGHATADDLAKDMGFAYI